MTKQKRSSIIGILPIESMADREQTERPVKRPPRRIVHTSVYVPSRIYRLLETIAFDRGRPNGRRTKIHDLIMEGLSVVLERHGHPPIEELRRGES
jgi:hypothetical protein